ncbi:thiopurine S-methyltransferase [Cellvibrio sp. OA-2007]|uniref:thiopurine S-methyltransferase n=1 Tax=Cellvibrio sp. OA-2007 TaxID=529823 RepID=UPI0007838E73|nr:thiopurine S-methyltransferase [Cellvibrio sp. OA-2007]
MQPEFWHKKWQESDIGFHNSDAHPLLVKHFPTLGLAAGSRVFLPLCGKTLDIHWLLAHGFQVVGAELSPIAIEQLFDELGVAPEITQLENLQYYRAPNIDVFVGDVFNVTASLLGHVDAVYDRAALVALPLAMRTNYTSHLKTITGNAKQLLICFEYDQTQLPGPPFSICDEELQAHYNSSYTIQLLESAEVIGKLKGQCPAWEKVWLLNNNAGII